MRWLSMLLVSVLFIVACVRVPKVILNETRLFDGEFVIQSDGIYTFAHYYFHPETGRRVILVGMNHGGDKEYFDQVAALLKAAEIVVFEGSAAKETPQKSKEKEAREDLEKLNGQDFNEAFLSAIKTYFQKVPVYLRLASEGKAINHKRANWYDGDQELFSEFAKNPEKAKQFEKEMKAQFAEYPLERKKPIVAYVRSALEEIKKGSLTRKDFADFFVLLWSDPFMVKLMLEMIGKPRDERVFKLFDRLVVEKSPKIVGIKFGAGHISNQRRLLEERGYIHQHSVPLRNLRF